MQWCTCHNLHQRSTCTHPPGAHGARSGVCAFSKVTIHSLPPAKDGHNSQLLVLTRKRRHHAQKPTFSIKVAVVSPKPTAVKLPEGEQWHLRLMSTHHTTPASSFPYLGTPLKLTYLHILIKEPSPWVPCRPLLSLVHHVGIMCTGQSP